MKKKAAQHGDLVAVPVGDCWAIGRVVFVSQYFKEIMQVEFRGAFEDPSADWYAGKKLCTLYTAASKFEKRGWKVVGSGCIEADDFERTLRLVASEVWKGDQVVRSVEPNDRGRIPMMNVDGFIRVERVLQKSISDQK